MVLHHLKSVALDSLCSSEQLQLFDSVDALRSQGISHYISLPQIIVCATSPLERALASKHYPRSRSQSAVALAPAFQLSSSSGRHRLLAPRSPSSRTCPMASPRKRLFLIPIDSQDVDQDVYHITPEHSPDGTLRRVDACVLRYDDAHDTLSAMLWVEFKRPSGSYVYVMTTVGVSFRARTVTEEDQVLEPFHGDLADRTRSQYINAEPNGAQILESFVFQARPLRIAPVVPSQPLPQSGYGQSGSGQSGYGGYAGLQQAYLPTDEQGGYAGESSVPGMGYQGQDMAPAIGEYGQTSAADDDQLVKVHFNRIKRYTRPDEYSLRDVNGQVKLTTKNDWRQIMYNGRTVWTTRRRGVSYYTRDTIV
ncbi:hypothetical protein QQZ08_010054 [Neonectria magnoliae]|uniref:Uncharacterized protein n=1 Tax=Neonectria magnoliae TaxID=2732573 RepID=A0ABR1HKR7_9HYPO